MKKLTIILCLLVTQTALSQSVYYSNIYGAERGQNTRRNIDTCLLRVTYDFAHHKDTIGGKRFYDRTCLEVGESVSKFYSAYAAMCDSLQYTFNSSAAATAGGFYQSTIVIQDSMSMEYVDYYFNYPEKGSVQKTRRIIKANFYYDEPIQNPVWEIASDTINVLGYQCQKAITKYYGRNWEAWFTFDIPYQMGPWKLHGLPGTVLKASTTDKLFDYTAIAIETPKKAHIYHYNERFVKSNRKQMRKYEELMYTDPVGLRLSFGSYIIVNYPEGSKPMAAGSVTLPYQPSLELE